MGLVQLEKQTHELLRQIVYAESQKQKKPITNDTIIFTALQKTFGGKNV